MSQKTIQKKAGKAGTIEAACQKIADDEKSLYGWKVLASLWSKIDNLFSVLYPDWADVRAMPNVAYVYLNNLKTFHRSVIEKTLDDCSSGRRVANKYAPRAPELRELALTNNNIEVETPQLPNYSNDDYLIETYRNYGISALRHAVGFVLYPNINELKERPFQSAPLVKAWVKQNQHVVDEKVSSVIERCE